MIKATLQFHSAYKGDWMRGKPSGWGYTRTFNDEEHMNNHIAYMERTKGHTIDEVWIWKDENNWR